MADLDPLIRLYKKRVDDKQKVLADIYRELEQYETMKKILLEELERESQVLGDMDGMDTQSFFGPYVDGVRKKIDVIDESISKIEYRVDLAREDVRRGFAELKKVEITAEQRAEVEAKEDAKKESDLMDEIGLDAYRRNNLDEE